MTATPGISVVMSVLNGADTLEAAVGSVLAQTFGAFEFIIIDDGSTDATPAILDAFDDPRILRIRHETPWGLTRSLNQGLDRARGAFVARMDADDLCHSDRFEKQAAFLRANPGAAVCGSWARLWIDGPTDFIARKFTDPAAVGAQLLFDTPIAHPSAMIRRSVLEAHDLRYDPEFTYAQDYDLWERIARIGELANLPEALLTYRWLGEDQISRGKAEQQRAFARRVRERAVTRAFPGIAREELDFHHAMAVHDAPHPPGHPGAACRWLQRLEAMNAEAGAFPEAALREVLVGQWRDVWQGREGRWGRGEMWAFWRCSYTREAFPDPAARRRILWRMFRN